MLFSAAEAEVGLFEQSGIKQKILHPCMSHVFSRGEEIRRHRDEAARCDDLVYAFTGRKKKCNRHLGIITIFIRFIFK